MQQLPAGWWMMIGRLSEIPELWLSLLWTICGLQRCNTNISRMATSFQGTKRPSTFYQSSFCVFVFLSAQITPSFTRTK
ncbi:hypothetical protein V8C44DRAFT_344090 [Trichoderma aethiopicum]